MGTPKVPPNTPTTVLDAEDLASGFRGGVTHAHRSVIYALGVVTLAACSITLWLAYACVVIGLLAGAILFGADLWAWANADMRWLRLPAVIMGGVITLVLILFGTRALLTVHKPSATATPIDPREDRLLKGYVEMLFVLLGVPAPATIRVGVEPSVSVRFTGGAIGVLRGRRDVTMGMPLIDTMSLRRFSGIVAHELGWHTPGSASRAVGIIVLIHDWLTGHLLRKDPWDRAMDRHLRFGGSPLSHLGCLLAKAFIRLARIPMYPLLVISGAIRGLVARQAAIDADRYQVQVAGADRFEPAMIQLLALKDAFSTARHDALARAAEGRLPDDLVALTSAVYSHRSDESRRALFARAMQARHPWWSPVPSLKRRCAAVAARSDAGLVSLETPARRLLQRPRALAQAVTRAAYGDWLGERLARTTLVKSDTILITHKSSAESDDHLDAYFGQTLSIIRPLRIGSAKITPARDPELVRDRLLKARDTARTGYAEHAAHFKTFDVVDDRIMALYQAHTLLLASEPARAQDLVPEAQDPDHLHAMGLKASAEQSAAAEAFAPTVEAEKARLLSALSLLYAPGADRILDDIQHARATAVRGVRVLGEMSAVYDAALHLRLELAALSAIEQAIKGTGKTEALWEQQQHALNRVAVAIGNLRDPLGGIEHPDPQIHRGTIARYLLQIVPTPGDGVSMHSAGQTCLDQYFGLSWKVLGELVAIAVKIEHAIDASTKPSSSLEPKPVGASASAQNPSS